MAAVCRRCATVQRRIAGPQQQQQCFTPAAAPHGARRHAAARGRRQVQAARAAAAAAGVQVAAEDKWIARTLTAVAPPAESLPQSLAALQSACLGAAATLRMPTTRNEEYRFTDVAPILQSALAAPPGAPPAGVLAAAAAARQMQRPTAASLVVVDGVLSEQLSSVGELPKGVYVGTLAGAPQDVASFALGAQSRGRGGPFATLNGAAARDVVVVHVPPHVSVPRPFHILYLSSASGSTGGTPASAPRLLVVLEEGAAAELIEEFAPAAAPEAEGSSSTGPYYVNSVAEIELDDASSLKHGYVELEATNALHTRATLVNQGARSNYLMIEARLGGALTRHDLGVDQLGEETMTQMRAFLLCSEGQLHDLHSKLKLDHPRGEAKQLHKCIVTHATGRGVFDGNVRVNRLAQKTDAQQLSRNLLLAPRATVNVKPNLQIIADDVKCTHGCSVSDLEDDELFYLQARGISQAAARQLLVYSFGREVVTGLQDEALIGRVEAAVKVTLLSAAL